jgi:glycosyltransferase involved in cell wall biosynthesis
VVTVAAGGTREVIGDGQTGILVPAGDEAMLSAAILQVLDSPPLAKSLVENAARSLHRFAPETMIAATESVLREAAEMRVLRT